MSFERVEAEVAILTPWASQVSTEFPSASIRVERTQCATEVTLCYFPPPRMFSVGFPCYFSPLPSEWGLNLQFPDLRMGRITGLSF